MVVRKPCPPQETSCGGLQPGLIRQVAAEGGADGSAELPIKGSQQVKDVSADTHVVPPFQ